ncbi:lytic murein transglycosylase [Beijerinckiaceae bacterium]|nr:lytic murein transglycosylase [Beijerinckiaceae bacterium]
MITFALCAAPSSGLALDPTSTAPAGSEAGFRTFLQALWPLAEGKGVKRATFDLAVAGLTLDPSTPAASNQQAEFDKPLKSYLDEAVSLRRIARGRELFLALQEALKRIEQRFGVPAEILLSAYGIETDYGRAKGGKDVIRSLATLAYQRQDRPIFRDELIGALILLDKGSVARAIMKGSWAGAMGGPQFLPTAYLKYAVSYDGASFADIWEKPLDALASIANFLVQSGWQPNLPWGVEVVLPENFSFASLHGSFAAFAAQGVRSANGTPFPQGEATLFLPSGGAGPAFLLSSNYWILKAYNNSDSYALSLSLLADRIKGRPALHGHWPQGEVFLSRTQKTEIQKQLERLGFYRGTLDGRFGQASRDAIHDFQIATKVRPADGHTTPELLNQLAAEVSRRPGQ